MQSSAKVYAPGLVNFVPALAYHFCPNAWSIHATWSIDFSRSLTRPGLQVALFGSLALMLFLFRESDLGTAYWVFTVMLPSINLLLFPLIQTLSSASLRGGLAAFLQMHAAATASAAVSPKPV